MNTSTAAPIECPLKRNEDSGKDRNPQTLFMVSNWRNQLCKCSNCEKIYQSESIEFLTDPEDTVHFYEAKSKEGSDSFKVISSTYCLSTLF